LNLLVFPYIENVKIVTSYMLSIIISIIHNNETIFSENYLNMNKTYLLLK